MKFVLIAPGEMSIPPRGWGAVEILIYDYACVLRELGHEVLIVNTRSPRRMAALANDFRPDFVHCQYDGYVDVLRDIQCPAKAVTSHFGYLDAVWSKPEYLLGIHKRILRREDAYIFALSPSIAERYRLDGVDPARVRVTPNGVRLDRFQFATTARLPDRSLCLAKVDYRKRQALLQRADPSVDFAGNLCRYTARPSGFDPSSPTYLGEWTKDRVHSQLTDYANLVLLSDGEAHALVCMEALAAGLGLVVSESATANLDLSRPFIDVIPESRLGDAAYVAGVIDANRRRSVGLRREIREYAATFDWGRVVPSYVETVRDVVAAGRPARRPRSVLFVAESTADRGATVAEAERARVAGRFQAEGVSVEVAELGPVAPVASLTPASEIARAVEDESVCARLAAVVDGWMRFDQVVFFGADSQPVEPLTFASLQRGLFCSPHRRYGVRPWAAPFEQDPGEVAYVPPTERRRYYEAGVFGGDPIDFKHLVVSVSRSLREERVRGGCAVLGEESHLNRTLVKLACPAWPPLIAERRSEPAEFSSKEAPPEGSRSEPAEPSDARGKLAALRKVRRLEVRLAEAESLRTYWASRVVGPILALAWVRHLWLLKTAAWQRVHRLFA